MSLRFEFRLFLFWCWMILCSDGVPRNRIVGGRPALPGALPSVVAIMRTKNRVFCGGTLVSPTHVLSAAHCFVHFRSLGKVTVMAGDVDRTKTTTNTRQSLEVKKVNSHPKFVLKTFENDYCVLEVSKANLNQNVQIIGLAEKRPHIRTKCTIAGWGYTDEDAISFNDVLMRTDVLVQNCSDSPLKVNGENMLCAGVDYGGIDSCQGDSGGPLFCNGKIAGIISFGKGCAIAGFYGVYADVAHAREWIHKTMGLKPRKLKNKLGQSGKASKQLKISAEKLMLSTFVIFYLSKVLATAHE